MVEYQASRCQNNPLYGEKAASVNCLGLNLDLQSVSLLLRLQSTEKMDPQVSILQIVIKKEQDTTWFVGKMAFLCVHKSLEIETHKLM